MILHHQQQQVAELGHGTGAADAGLRSSQIYGLAGEATLNFGIPGAVLVFVPFGFAVRLAQGAYRAARGPTAHSTGNCCRRACPSS